MTTADVDLTTLVEETYRLATAGVTAPGMHETEFLVKALTSGETGPEYAGGEFPLSIATATAIRRQRGAAPTLVLVPSTEVAQFIASIRPRLDLLGLRFGFDIIVCGLEQLVADEPNDGPEDAFDINLDRLFEPDPDLEVAVPQDHPDDVWDDVKRLQPGLVALLGQTPNGLPGAFSEQVEHWVRGLPNDVPVLCGWETDFGTFTSVPPSAVRRQHPRVSPASRIRREAESTEVASQLLRRSPQIISITGRPGSGRSTLLAEVAAQVQASGQPMSMRLFTTRGQQPVDELQETLEYLVSNEARIPEVIVIDDFDVISRLGKKGSIDRDFIDRISQISHLEIVRILIVLDDRYLDDLTDLDKSLADRIIHVRPGALPRHDLEEAIRAAIGPHAETAGFALDEAIISAALSPAATDEFRAQPGLGIDRTEAAIARARQRRSMTLSVEDFEAVTARTAAPTAGQLKTALSSTVKGQDQALETIAERLAPTLAGLKLRPERPQGVLLFVGPSGVGKTETAKQLATTVYGTADALIVLDMTEYANQEDARMKLIGASPVWKNSSTDGLLTTKVIQKPRSVVLLDEFEKAHPLVWNIFLPVFDEGRLTDGWGNVADFSDTIVIMTSNLGVREGSARTAGFGHERAFDAKRQDAAIAEALPPELLNRITATVRFDALSQEAIRELARMELERAFSRFAKRGWHIDFDEKVIEWAASAGYDACYGARHVQRTIETEIFPHLAATQPRSLRLAVEGGTIVVASDNQPYELSSEATQQVLDP